MVDIVESRDDLALYQKAIPDADFQVVRLKATLPTILRRLEGRESGEGLMWHQHRAVELSTQMDERAVEDLLIDTEGRSVADIAREVLVRVGWASAIDLS